MKKPIVILFVIIMMGVVFTLIILLNNNRINQSKSEKNKYLTMLITNPISKIKTGRSHKYKTSVFESAGNACNNYKVEWTSSDDKIAIIDMEGKLVAKSKGTVLIKAKIIDDNDYSTKDLNNRINHIERSVGSLTTFIVITTLLILIMFVFTIRRINRSRFTEDFNGYIERITELEKQISKTNDEIKKINEKDRLIDKRVKVIEEQLQLINNDFQIFGGISDLIQKIKELFDKRDYENNKNDAHKIDSENKVIVQHILYADYINDGYFDSITENANQDTVFELIIDRSEVIASFSVYQYAYKRVILRPAFLEGCKKQVLGKTDIEIMQSGTAEKQSDGRWKVTRELELKIV